MCKGKKSKVVSLAQDRCPGIIRSTIVHSALALYTYMCFLICIQLYDHKTQMQSIPDRASFVSNALATVLNILTISLCLSPLLTPWMNHTSPQPGCTTPCSCRSKRVKRDTYVHIVAQGYLVRGTLGSTRKVYHSGKICFLVNSLCVLHDALSTLDMHLS